MSKSDFWLRDAEGIEIFVRHFQPDKGRPKAAIQIEHGVAEHSGRYFEMARRFCDAGYACYADDHRGHGRTAESTGGPGKIVPGGWDAVVRDLALITDRIEADHPGLPVLIMSGSDDASNNRLADLRPLAARYRTRWNLADVTEKYYEGARHEIFHELNRDEVFADCIGWLDGHLGS